MDVKYHVSLYRKMIGTIITLLRKLGPSYMQIEHELNLRPNKGMTASRFVNKHRPKGCICPKENPEHMPICPACEQIANS